MSPRSKPSATPKSRRKRAPAAGAAPGARVFATVAVPVPVLPTALGREALARHKELDALLKRVSVLRQRGAAEFDALHELIATGLDGEPPLYRARYETEKAYLAVALPNESYRTAKRNLLVAVAFTPDDESHHTLEFLEKAALYAKAKLRSAAFPRAIDLDRLRVEVTRGRDALIVSAREATEEELDRARAAITGTPRKRPPKTVAALRSKLQANAALREVVVEGGDEIVTFRRVPVASLRAFGRAVATTAVE